MSWYRLLWKHSGLGPFLNKRNYTNKNMNIQKIQEKVKEFFKEVYVELKRVSWLSKNDIIKYTLIVLVVTIVVSSFLGGLDFIFSSLIKMFILN